MGLLDPWPRIAFQTYLATEPCKKKFSVESQNKTGKKFGVMGPDSTDLASPMPLLIPSGTSPQGHGVSQNALEQYWHG